MPTINAEASGEIGVTITFRYLEKKLKEITERLDAIEQRLKRIEDRCSGGAVGHQLRRNELG